MNNSRWTDEFLDYIGSLGDAEADDCYAQLDQNSSVDAVDIVFRKMDSNDDVPPGILMPMLADFFKRTGTLPPGTDIDRIHRGEEVFCAHAFEEALILLTKGLPEGYAAPNLSIILNISGDLKTHPYRRLLATLQAVINVTTCGGFQDSGRAVITAQKLRLLHAGIRSLTRKYRPQFESQYGVPSNLEDMLGTIMGFSYLVVIGLRKLNAGLTKEQEEDCFYIWRIYALMMGIYPPGEPTSFAFIPDSVDDAGVFYEAYKRRHYVTADKNPDGVVLAAANLQMLKHFIPKILKLLRFGVLPRVYMHQLMGPEMCARVAIPPVWGGKVVKAILGFVYKILHDITNKFGNDDHRFAMALFQGMIDISLDGQVTFTVPDSLQDMKQMAK